jgi:hypothetical protein
VVPLKDSLPKEFPRGDGDLLAATVAGRSVKATMRFTTTAALPAEEGPAPRDSNPREEMGVAAADI